MYTFSRTFIETIKLFCLSLICSAIFSAMIFQEDVAPFAFVCFVLNFVAALLFLLFIYRIWSKIFYQAYFPYEFWIPTLVPYLIYLLVSTVCYVIANNPEFLFGVSENPYEVPKVVASVRIFYRYLFQHTRFLEPMLNGDYAFVSFILSHVMTVGVLLYIPYSARRR